MAKSKTPENVLTPLTDHEPLLPTVQSPAPAQPTLLETQIRALLDKRPIENAPEFTITLSAKDLARISNALGGKILKTGLDVVHVVEGALRVRVDGCALAMDIEDAQALADYFPSSGILNYREYLEASVKEALSVYLWGSTRGLISR